MVYIKVIVKEGNYEVANFFSVPKSGIGDIVGRNKSVKLEIKVVSSYWDIECKASPSSPACLVFED